MLHLRGVQNGLIAAVAALGKPFVVVLEGGSVIDMSAWYANAPAVPRTGLIVPGQGARVPIPLRIKDLQYWDSASSRWKGEAGLAKVIVAPNAAAAGCTGGTGPNCALSDTFMLNWR